MKRLLVLLAAGLLAGCGHSYYQPDYYPPQQSPSPPPPPAPGPGAATP